MSIEYPELVRGYSSQLLRLETLIKIRWLAVLGQSVAVAVVWWVFDFEFEAVLCFALIAASALLNIVFSLRFPPNTRLSELASTLLLAYDIIQLALLLFLTGGLGNPFSLLIMVPVVISATTLSVPATASLTAVAVIAASLLAFFYLPLPWVVEGGLKLPWVYMLGTWFAIVAGLLFTAVYAFRVADESRKLADALAATELVLQRERHLSNMDGLAAAAAHELGTPLATISLVAKELMRELENKSPHYEDAVLLRSQAERCREILRTLTSLSTEGDQHLGVAKFSSILDEVCEPHRNFGIQIGLEYPKNESEPKCFRNPGIIYGLGNLVENAVDYAKKKVQLIAEWNEEEILLRICDDGPGFNEEVLMQIGEPFMTSRSTTKPGGGLGLGLFIAKTLLERSGASIKIGNSFGQELRGAEIQLVWPRSAIAI